MNLKYRHGCAQSGIGLVEVLVALLVLSVGFLASANMQIRGLRSSQDSHYRTQALMLADEMMDRMRNNRRGVLAGDYNGMTTDSAATKPACASSGCDSAGIAQLDHFEWSANLHNLRNDSSFIPMLPPAQNSTPASAAISAPLADGVFTLTMSWKIQDGENDIDQSLVVRFVP